MKNKKYKVKLIYTVYADVEVSNDFDPEDVNDVELFEKAADVGFELLQEGDFEMDMQDFEEVV
jgi:hypothetical protein